MPCGKGRGTTTLKRKRMCVCAAGFGGLDRLDYLGYGQPQLGDFLAGGQLSRFFVENAVKPTFLEARYFRHPRRQLPEDFYRAGASVPRSAETRVRYFRWCSRGSDKVAGRQHCRP